MGADYEFPLGTSLDMSRIDQGTDLEVVKFPMPRWRWVRYLLIRTISLLPFGVLRRLYRRFPDFWPSLPFVYDPESWGIFLDADYWKWVRIDKRRSRHN